jgi:hypothetical protein
VAQVHLQQALVVKALLILCLVLAAIVTAEVAVVAAELTPTLLQVLLAGCAFVSNRQMIKLDCSNHQA